MVHQNVADIACLLGYINMRQMNDSLDASTGDDLIAKMFGTERDVSKTHSV